MTFKPITAMLAFVAVFAFATGAFAADSHDAHVIPAAKPATVASPAAPTVPNAKTSVSDLAKKLGKPELSDNREKMMASTTAFEAANKKMHAAMPMDYTGNADIDFVRGMIPHHQGAVDTANIVLKYGKDPEIKKLATDIIAAQNKEIAWMQDWLKKQQSMPTKPAN